MEEDKRKIKGMYCRDDGCDGAWGQQTFEMASNGSATDERMTRYSTIQDRTNLFPSVGDGFYALNSAGTYSGVFLRKVRYGGISSRALTSCYLRLDHDIMWP